MDTDLVINRIRHCATVLRLDYDADDESADILRRLADANAKPAGTYNADLLAVLQWAEYRLEITKAYS